MAHGSEAFREPVIGADCLASAQAPVVDIICSVTDRTAS